MATPMLDLNHLQKVHVGEIKMKLPIPVFNDNPSHLVRTKRKIRERDVKEALKGFDLKKVYEQLIEQTDNMTPLTVDEFKKVENQWVFMREPRGYLYLMFKEDNKTPNTQAHLYFYDMNPLPRLRNGELKPVRDEYWESAKFTIYSDGYESIISWADAYLVGSNKMTSFMNWRGNPLIK